MIYTVENTSFIGRRARVFVNGNKIKGAFYADTVKGIVKYYPQPARIKKPERDRVYSRVAKGKVTVELIED